MDDEIFVVGGVEYQVGDDVNYSILHWSSDWNGYEVGHDDVNVVGLYCFQEAPDVWIYLDVEEQTIIEMWRENDE